MRFTLDASWQFLHGYVQRQQQMEAIPSEVGRFAFSGKQKKRTALFYMCVFFLWQPNELLIFPLLGVSTIPPEFQSAVLSLCTGGLSSPPFIFIIILLLLLFAFILPLP